MEKITYKKIKQTQEVNAYIEQGNHVLGVLGYTEHSLKHAAKVAETAGKILQKLDFDDHTVELARSPDICTTWATASTGRTMPIRGL